ncbi:unnamed protein product [Mytilus edulis]|uniref:SRCR domain-containing protein n=1 Tax=Mytilus edulis TaxID=6550 RepID=A0A8S3V1Y3_MYTED|nr:unnamed protein product [Mytilus edulis]
MVDGVQYVVQDLKDDASVICRMLGLQADLVHGTAFTNSYFGEGSGTAMLSNLKLNSTANFIGNNKYKGTIQTHIGLDIRLALGQTKGDGRLEIKYDGKWGTVCSETGLRKTQICVQNVGDTLPYLYHLPSLEMHRSAFELITRLSSKHLCELDIFLTNGNA